MSIERERGSESTGRVTCSGKKREGSEYRRKMGGRGGKGKGRKSKGE